MLFERLGLGLGLGLGLLGLGSNSQFKPPDEIHKMDESWQPYSADSFGKVVRSMRKIISKYLSCSLLSIIMLQ